jgi:putative transposase
LSDNGSAMVAAEIAEGLARFGVVHQTTLPYGPYQNPNSEIVWSLVEGRLLAMLEGVADLPLAFLNEATQAWAEYEYNCKAHSEIGQAPGGAVLAGPDDRCQGIDVLARLPAPQHSFRSANAGGGPTSGFRRTVTTQTWQKA